MSMPLHELPHTYRASPFICGLPRLPEMTCSLQRCCGKAGAYRPEKLLFHFTASSERSDFVIGTVPLLQQRQLTRQQRRVCQGVSRQVRAAAGLQIGSALDAATLPQPQLVALPNPAISELAEGLEAPIQLLYLLALLGFLAAGAYLVVRQVFVRRDLEEAAKVLGERIRTNSGNAEDFFELGVILLRKKLFTQATRNLEKAKKSWQGEEDELAKVHNALGFAYFNMDKSDLAVTEYKRAVELQPGYVTAWNNLGNAYEKASKIKDAYEAYKEALSYAPTNSTAKQRSEALQARL